MRASKSVVVGWTSLAVAATAACGLGASCDSRPPKPAHTAAETEPAEPERTAEWLFVTEQGQVARGPKAECEKVAGWVLGENGCTGELCTHARDLGREWMQRCAKIAAAQRDEVKAVVSEVSRRADLPPDACITQVNDLMRSHSCGEPDACLATAQRWVARCGERYATPLVVLMLARTSERRFKESRTVQLDRRSCKALAEQIAAAAGCDGEQACEPGTNAAAAFLERCVGKDAPLPIRVALGVADVLVGASRPVEPMLVEAESGQLPEGAASLALGDGRGAVVWVCGERPKDLDAFLQVRRRCSPGEVIVARLDGARRLRVVSVPHASDADFARLFPFLELKGERDARERAEVGAFRKAVRDAAEMGRAGRAADAVAVLTAALLPRAAALGRRAEMRAALSEADADLVPVLREWGRRKAAAGARLRPGLELGSFAGRALVSPLADMRLDGSVLAGAFAPPASAAIARWMPLSVAAYRKELARLEPEIKKLRANGAALEQLRASVASETAACAAAESAVSKAEDAAARCLFGDGTCAPAQAVSLSSAADPDREKATRALRAVFLVLASSALEAAEVGKLDAERVGAGCLDL